MLEFRRFFSSLNRSGHSGCADCASITGSPKKPTAVGTLLRHPALDVVTIVLACFIYHGTPPPGINEAHYLVKARHFWDPSFCAGDLFVESPNVHFIFYAVFGALTACGSLTAAAWIGRFLCWLALAVSLTAIARQHSRIPLAGLWLTLAWLAAMHWGHASGEWVVGGVEAKCLAYACLLAALVAAGRRDWFRCWLWLGAAAAWHVLVGGWGGLLLMSVRGISSIRRRLEPTAAGSPKPNPLPAGLAVATAPASGRWGDAWGVPAAGLLASYGLLPAWLGTRSPDQQLSAQAAEIYVFERLPHHLRGLTFAAERWWAFAALTILSMLVALAWWRLETSPDHRRRLSWLWGMAWLSLGLSAIGLMLDLWLSSNHPQLAAGWLRFYWFRLADFCLPLALASTLLRLTNPLGASPPAESSGRRSWPGSVAAAALVACLLSGSWLLGVRYVEGMRHSYSESDWRGLFLARQSLAQRQQTYRDWVDVCDWVSSESPVESVWLTPRYQQTFKWRTGRAELVNWKDVPQDPAGLIEWRARMQAVYGYRTDRPWPTWDTEQLEQLRRRYRFDFVLIDRRIQSTPPLLPLVYPLNEADNRTFAVFAAPILAGVTEPQSDAAAP
jgi:hypothetical protein